MGISESETYGRRDESGTGSRGVPSLDRETKLPVRASSEDRFSFTLYPGVGEVVATRVVREPRSGSLRSAEPDVERSHRSAAQRAKTKVRRYALHNGLRWMWTLTYAEATFDPDVVARDVERFLARVIAHRGGERFPYVRVFEWHKSGHGIHVHMGVPFWFDHADLGFLWGKGFVWTSDMKPRGIAAEVGFEKAAQYLTKYVGKAFAVAQGGRHRYECAQGFPVTSYRFRARSMDDGAAAVREAFPRGIRRVWKSWEQKDWEGPDVLLVAYDGPAGGPGWERLKAGLDAYQEIGQ